MMNMIPQDYKYIERTVYGDQILSIWQDRTGFLNIVGYRPRRNDYFFARGYDPSRGDWIDGGSYDYESQAEAEHDLLQILNRHYGPINRFDAHDPRDVSFEYDAYFYYNVVGDNFMKTHNHRDPDFTKKVRTSPGYQSRRTESGGYFGDGKIYSDDEEGFDEFRRDHRRQNRPSRTMNAAPRTAVKKAVKPAAKKAPAKKTAAKPIKKPAVKKTATKKVTKAPAKKTTVRRR